jgi:hypothetical protein
MGYNRKQGDRAKRGNPVAKYAHEFNRAATQVDRKKAQKRGKQKHRKPLYE